MIRNLIFDIYPPRSLSKLHRIRVIIIYPIGFGVVAHESLALDLTDHLLPIGDEAIELPKCLDVNGLDIRLYLIPILLEMLVFLPYDLHRLLHFLQRQVLQPNSQLVLLLSAHFPLVEVFRLGLRLLHWLYRRCFYRGLHHRLIQ
ncbi:hypothetical protein I3842_06G162100 [Carya illinoinensis]|uniref:Uncharacterized protein n=1 Tax=Carya illinoinensis TaxID=32201 RepID=A0A922JJN3_CARIL|nr:hypothetical protein I3842_06G162100 [Carya illinoinensis]